MDVKDQARIPARQLHPTDTTPATHCAHGVRMSRWCFDCPQGR